MHKEYNPEDLKLWLQYYASQAKQVGFGYSGLPGFKGLPYQRGAGLGSFFRSLYRLAVPVLKSAASSIGKKALTAGAQIAQDVAQGRSVGESLKQHSTSTASSLLKEAGEALEKRHQQTGSGLGRRPKSINTRQKDIFTKFIRNPQKKIHRKYNGTR